jgi:hypothetical protein
MNTYHVNINIPVPFVPNKVEDHTTIGEVSVTADIINKEFVDWLVSIGLTIECVRFFGSKPYSKYRIHVDGQGLSTKLHCVKLNLVFDSSDTIMKWYEMLPEYNGDFLPNSLGEPTKFYDPTKCNVLYSSPVNSHCILNAGIPHDLTNRLNHRKMRKCYSIFLIKTGSLTRLTWDEALILFEPYITEV